MKHIFTLRLNTKSYHTALLLFTRSASEEVKYKNFSPSAGHRGNVLIARKLVAHATSLAKKAGVDFFIFTEKEQSRGSFGQRLAHAYEEIFAKGYRHVITIGNDSPDLNSKTLKKAIDKLDNDQAVIGPSADGGVYLLGLSRAQFNKETFITLRWQTSALTDDIIQELLPSSKISWLAVLQDIDHADDFHTFLKNSKSSLKWVLIRLLGLSSETTSEVFLIIKNHFPYRLLSKRGPPTPLFELIYSS